jgi:hypothetical protein
MPATVGMWQPNVAASVQYVHQLHGERPLPDVDFIITYRDGVMDDHLPIFCFTQFADRCILTPDNWAYHGYEPGRSEILASSAKLPWSQKKPLAFYRGADQLLYDVKLWQQHRRPRLVGMSLEFPDEIDARLTLCYGDVQLQHATQLGYMAATVDFGEHARYKYPVSIEAGCASTPRLPMLLCSNSLVVHNSTESHLWFHRAFLANQHYLPFAHDLSDIRAQLKWAREHDDECNQMATACHRLAEQVLTAEMAFLYLFHLIESFAKIQNAQSGAV